MTTFSNRLRLLLNAAGINKNELAQRSGAELGRGVLRSVVNRWPTTDTLPAGEFLPVLPRASVPDLNGHSLLTGEGPMPPPRREKTAAEYACGLRDAAVATERTVRQVRARAARKGG